jgi:hypothetical protein
MHYKNVRLLILKKCIKKCRIIDFEECGFRSFVIFTPTGDRYRTVPGTYDTCFPTGLLKGCRTVSEAADLMIIE